MPRAKWGGGALFFLGLAANFLDVNGAWRLFLCLLALAGAIIWFVGYMSADDPKHERTETNVYAQHSSGVVAGRDAHVHHYHKPVDQAAEDDEARQLSLKLSMVESLNRKATHTVMRNPPHIDSQTIQQIEEPIEALLNHFGAFKSEADVVAVCSHLQENTEWADPFVSYELGYGAGSFTGKRLQFLRDILLSGQRIRNDIEALRFLESNWAKKNGLKERSVADVIADLKQAFPKYDRNNLSRAVNNANLIKRRLAEVEKVVTGNLPNVDLRERLGIPPDVSKQIETPPQPIEPVEPQPIEEAFSIDRDFTWPAFRELGSAVKYLNEGIGKYNEAPTSALSHELLRRIEVGRKLIVTIETEQVSRGAS